MAVEHARKCGERLNQAKAQVGHGGFIPWLEANCQVKPRQAQKFMRLAREWPAIEAKCASDAHLTIDGALRLLDSGENLPHREPAEIAGATTRTVQQVGAERRQSDPTLSGSDRDPYDEDADPFGEGWEDGHTDADGQDTHQEMLPRPPSKDGDDEGTVGDEAKREEKPRDPKETWRLAKAKAVKTSEALIRAISDMNELRKQPKLNDALKRRVYAVIEEIKSW